MEVVRAADVGVIDRRSVRGLSRCAALEIVLEDGSERGIGRGADLQGSFAGRFQPFAALGLGEAEDADTGAEALFGMGFGAQDDVDQDPGMGPVGGGRLRMRSGVQLAWRRCAEGICSATVVWRRFPEPRMWAVTRLALWKTSTVRSVIRTQSFCLARAWGTE